MQAQKQADYEWLIQLALIWAKLYWRHFLCTRISPLYSTVKLIERVLMPL